MGSKICMGEKWMGRKLLSLVALLFTVAVALLSCATTGGILQSEEGTTREAGVWHRVEEGQTLWRIAKTYRVSLEDVKSVNDIQDVVHVAKGTWIFIPGAEEVLYVQGSTGSEPGEALNPEFVWPINGEIVQSFGESDADFNYGIDIGSVKSQDVVATLEGTVVLSGLIRGYGTTIIIEHENDFCSLYAKNIKSLVREGQRVNRNSIIARAESSTFVPGDVVHYELFYKGKPVNPLYYLP